MKKTFVCLLLALCLPGFSQVWTTKQSMPIGRHRHSAAAGTDPLGVKRVYVLAGGNDSQSYNSTYGYNPANNTWAAFANIPTPRVYTAAAALNGKIYVIGGLNGGFSNGLNTVEAYDTVSDTWSTVASLPYTLTEAAAAVYGGQLYVFGGYQPNSGIALNKTYCYNPGTNTWTQKANMPAAAYGIGAATACNGKIYVIGYNVNYEYTPSLNTWATKAVAPSTQRGHSVVIGSDQRIYLINDRNYNTSSDPVIHYYRFTNNTWYTAPNNIKGYTLGAAAHLSNRLYITGGTVRFSPLTDRVEQTSLLASCSCFHNMIICALKAIDIKYTKDVAVLGPMIDGGGVTLEHDNTTKSAVRWDGLLATEGSRLTVSGQGFVAGETGSDVGNVSFSQEGGNVQIIADLSSLGGRSFRIEAYDRGQLVATSQGDGTLAGLESMAWPSGSGFSQADTGESSIDTSFAEATLITAQGLNVIADEIRIISEGGLSFDSVDNLSISGDQIQGMTITSTETGESAR